MRYGVRRSVNTRGSIAFLELLDEARKYGLDEPSPIVNINFMRARSVA